MWSPKANSNGSLNHFYETMREVSQGDIVFSFKNRRIMAMGIALGSARTCPKPAEFGSSGANWNNVGWRVDVAFKVLDNTLEPRKHMSLLSPLLPKRYSPLRADGTGNQMYLAEIPEILARALMSLIGLEAMAIEQDSIEEKLKFAESEKSAYEHDLIFEKWDEVQIETIRKDKVLTVTEKEQVICSRRGQGMFRNRVAELEKCCRITQVDRPEHLIASHIKPWRVSKNDERLDGENGLFLTPSVDHLFNDGYISFRDNGNLLISPIAVKDALNKMGIPKEENYNAGAFSNGQKQYLDYHRDSIFLKARG